MDALVGRTRKSAAGDGTLLIVVSDHGFSTFRKGVDLNRWLEESGYLKAQEGRRNEEHLAGDRLVGNAGLCHRPGRHLPERQGQVLAGHCRSGARRIFSANEIAQQVGRPCRPGNRGSRPCGGFTRRRGRTSGRTRATPRSDRRLRARLSRFLGNGHRQGYDGSLSPQYRRPGAAIIHRPSLVPGVLFCNRPVESENPRLMDIGPTVLDLFGVAVPGYMDGKALSVGDARGDGRSGQNDHSPLGSIMAEPSRGKLNRRRLLKRSAAVAAAAAAAGSGSFWLSGRRRTSRSGGKKVIVIGIDGMDPRLSELMLNAGLLPNLGRLRGSGSYSRLAHQHPAAKPGRVGEFHQWRRPWLPRDLRLHPPPSG